MNDIAPISVVIGPLPGDEGEDEYSGLVGELRWLQTMIDGVRGAVCDASGAVVIVPLGRLIPVIRCGCGATYIDGSLAWNSLPPVGRYHESEPGYPDLMQRNCTCGSTISAPRRQKK